MTKTLTDHLQSSKGTCSCGDSYIGDTMRNVQMRFHERTNSRGDSEPARYLRVNPSHSLSWCILCTAQSITKRIIREGVMIQLKKKPSLNRHVLFTALLRNCSHRELRN